MNKQVTTQRERINYANEQ